MNATLARYVLPSRFVKRYLPVKSHPHEKALAGHLFHPNAADFFIRMATVNPVPPEAVWSVLPPKDAFGPFHVATGRREDLALAYVICQVPFASGAALEFPLVCRLSYRARLRINTLQGLLDDLRQAGQLATTGDIAAFIQRRIEELKV